MGPALADTKVTTRAEWQAEEPKAAAEGQKKANGKIEYLTIHHTGSSKEKKGTAEAQLLRNVQNGHLYKKAKTEGNPVVKDDAGKPVPHFGDIAYHYLIGNSGAIYEGRDIKTAPASYEHYYSKQELEGATYSKTGAAVPKGPVEKSHPGASEGYLTVSFLCGYPNDELLSAKAMDNAAKFIAELLIRNKLTPQDIRVHREVANSECPGEKIYAWLRGDEKNPSSLKGAGGKLIVKYYDELKKKQTP